jgi:hypothetical protein
MAITFAQNYFRNSAGVQWEILGRLSLDNSYPTGGYSIDPLQFGLSQVTNFSVTDNVSGYGFDYNATTQKLLIYQAGGSGATFNGTPDTLTGAVSNPGFTGNALGTHSHNLASTSDSLPVTVYRVYHGAVAGGPFQVGETIVGSISTGGGVVTVVGAIYLDFASVTGLFSVKPLPVVLQAQPLLQDHQELEL